MGKAKRARLHRLRVIQHRRETALMPVGDLADWFAMRAERLKGMV